MKLTTQQTNVQVTSASGALAAVIVILLSAAAPEFVERLPAGLESGLTTLFIAAFGLAFNKDTVIVGKGGTGPVAVVLLGLVMLAGCETTSRIVTPQTIAVSAAGIEATANTVRRKCGNIEPGRPCRSDAVVTTKFRDDAKRLLEDALKWLDTADEARIAGNNAAAAGAIAQITQVLILIRSAIGDEQ